MGLRKNQARVFSSSEGSNFQISFSDVHSDGYRENSEYDRSSVNLIGQVFSKNRNMLSIIANYIDLTGFIPSSIDSATFYSNPRAAAASWKNARGFEAYDKGILGLSYQFDISPGIRKRNQHILPDSAMLMKPDPSIF